MCVTPPTDTTRCNSRTGFRLGWKSEVLVVLGTFPRFGAQCYSQPPIVNPFHLQFRARLDGMFFALTGIGMAINESDDDC